MTIPARINVKTVSAVLYAVLLLQPSQGFSANVACGEAIKELDFGQQLGLDSKSIDQKIQNLAELKLALDLAKIEGKTSIEVGALESHYEKKERDLIDYLEENRILTRGQFLEKMRHIISKVQKQKNSDDKNEAKLREEQKKQIKDLQVDGRRAIFHRIKPGPFKMGKVGEEKDVTLTKSFDMMATPTTQLFYRRVAELAMLRFPEGYRMTTSPSAFWGELHPVTNVSWNRVQMWLSALNDLSEIGEPELVDLIPNHKQGDVYRLPTEAEWEFVMKGRGVFNDIYHFGNNKAELEYYAWYSKNADKTTHPVAEKKPLLVDGKHEYYDMHGNVHEWVQDIYAPELSGGTDPQGPSKETGFYVARGGGWCDTAANQHSAYRLQADGGGVGHRTIGFRIVRDVK